MGAAHDDSFPGWRRPVCDWSTADEKILIRERLKEHIEVLDIERI